MLDLYVCCTLCGFIKCASFWFAVANKHIIEPSVMSNYKVYISNPQIGVPGGLDTQEIEEAFGKYGRLEKVWVARTPPGFGFIEVRAPRPNMMLPGVP
jgi:hypothetical protein